MTQRPISFSDSMVEAIRADRKTMTRRPKRIQPSTYEKEEFKLVPSLTHSFGRIAVPIPYGEVGDQLYVKETYYQYGHWKRNGLTKKGNPKWKFVPFDENIRYTEHAPSSFKKSRSKTTPEVNFWYKRLARFMPRKYARIVLEITELREERLQDISEQDAIREGIEKYYAYEGAKCQFKNYLTKDIYIGGDNAAKKSFKTLWISIYGESSWDENPVVNVIGFKVIKK